MEKSLPIIGAFARNKAIVKMAVPVFLELILSVAMGYVTQFLLTPIPLASNGVSQANQIANIFIVSFSVLSSSSLILLCQLVGKGDDESAKKIYPLSVYLNLLIGVIVALAVFGFSFFVFSWMGVKENVIPFAKAFLALTAPSFVFQALTNVFSAFLRANKRMVPPTAIAFISNAVNAIVGAIFIFGIPGLTEMEKLYGVAISADLSRLVALIASYVFYKKTVGASLSIKLLRPFPGSILRRLLGIGLPTAGETLSYQASQLVLAVIINLSVGVLEQNLRNYLITFTSIIYLFAQGTGVAMQVVEGQLLGKGDKEGAERLVQDVGTMARTVSAILSILLLCLSYPIFQALLAPAQSSTESNPTGISLHAIGIMALLCMVIDVFLDQGRATNLVYVKGLETSGDILFPVSCSMVTSWVCTVGVSALLCLVFKLGVYGAFIGAALDEISRAIMFYVRWKRGKWKARSITEGLS